jgi:hypothetical protein
MFICVNSAPKLHAFRATGRSRSLRAGRVHLMTPSTTALGILERLEHSEQNPSILTKFSSFPFASCREF